MEIPGSRGGLLPLDPTANFRMPRIRMHNPRVTEPDNPSTTLEDFVTEYVLPELDYDYAALEPHISAKIMELHHSKHHAAYVTGANNALAQLAEAREKGDFANINRLSKDLAFHTGGHINHSVFWKNLSPDGGDKPEGELAAAIDDAFGSFDAFKDEFKAGGVNRFGSGWSWLVHDGTGLAVYSTANQDSPIMQSDEPLLGIDVWEHAYYLKYQNRRPDYLEAWWNVVNWPAVAERYDRARGKVKTAT